MLSIVYNLVSAEVVLVLFKITKRTMRPDMSYIRCYPPLDRLKVRVMIKAVSTAIDAMAIQYV